ncbi:uncharacterized protein LOC141854094 [Brevipalpus obovatus]|uniref:uncharacterized protein LOC141854094 n=1 Tax=Brevipalpus obovatus TaxID=246614 RepID=UPI003D9FABC7
MRFSTVVVFAFVVVLSVVSGAFSDRASRYAGRGAQQQETAAAAQQGRSLEAKALKGFQQENTQEHIAAAPPQQGRAAGARAIREGTGAAAMGSQGGANQAPARQRGLNMGNQNQMAETLKMMTRGMAKVLRMVTESAE